MNISASMGNNVQYRLKIIRKWHIDIEQKSLYGL